MIGQKNNHQHRTSKVNRNSNQVRSRLFNTTKGARQMLEVNTHVMTIMSV